MRTLDQVALNKLDEENEQEEVDHREINIQNDVNPDTDDNNDNPNDDDNNKDNNVDDNDDNNDDNNNENIVHAIEDDDSLVYQLDLTTMIMSQQGYHQWRILTSMTW